MKKALFILLICSLHVLQAADTYQVGDTLYVWAKSGLPLRAQPGLDAEKKALLKWGEAIEVLAKTSHTWETWAVASHPQLYADRVKHEFPNHTDQAYVLTGHWVKVKSDQGIGYIMDIYMLRLVPPQQKASFRTYLESLHRAPLKIDTTWNTGCEDPIDCFSYESMSVNGIHISGREAIYAGSERIHLSGFTLEEAFIFYRAFLPLTDSDRRGTSMDYLKLVKSDSKRLIFVENDACDLSFYHKADTVVISRDCFI